MTKKYCLSRREFVLLGSMNGLESFYGFNIIQEDKLTQKEINDTLFLLAKKEFISPDGERLVTEETLAKIIGLIKSPRRIWSIIRPDAAYPDKCLYIADDRATVVEPGGVDGKYLKIGYGEKKEICREVLEDGVYQKAMNEEWRQEYRCEEIDKEEAAPADRDLFATLVDRGMDVDTDMLRQEEIRTVVREPGKKLIYVLRGQLYDWLFQLETDKEPILFYYSDQKLDELLEG